MVDKPGRRKKKKVPWTKIAGGVLAVVVVGAGWYVYWDYIYSPPPVYAQIGTSFGTVGVELYPSCAPSTVANFVNLAKSGFYDNLVWHRIVDKSTPAFVIQTGDPNTRGGVNSTRDTWGKGGSGATVPLEFCGRLHNYAGYLGMARGSDPNSGTSQFYVNLSNGTANLSLDPNYTVFGKVITGMGVVCQIAHVGVYPATATQNGASITDQPITPVFMKNVSILSSPPTAAPQTITACT